MADPDDRQHHRRLCGRPERCTPRKEVRSCVARRREYRFARPRSPMTSLTTENTRRAALLESQRRLLDRIASGAPLRETLEMLVELIEQQASGMRAAVLLADSAQQQLRFVAAPSIPEDYKVGIEPYLRIGPDMGSCGTAAFLRQAVYTRDTATDPLWENCGQIAVRNGLRAIWSTPILSDGNVVLGTFAMYYGEPRLPAEEHIQLIDMATQMARVAIEAKADDDMLRMVFEGAPDGILITDLAGVVVRVNPAFAAMLGYTPAELHGKKFAHITQEEDARALMEELLSPGRGEVASDRRYRRRSGAILWAREREVLELVIAGRTSKQIAARLGIAAASVDTYRSRLMLKLSIEDLPGLVRFAIRHGIASL